MEIRSERLLLRDLGPGDFAEAFAFAGDPDAATHSTWGALTEAETREWLAAAAAQADPGRATGAGPGGPAGSRPPPLEGDGGAPEEPAMDAGDPPRGSRRTFDLGIVHEGRLIGTVYLGPVGAPELRTAEVGYTLHPGCWGRGFATEVVRAISGYAFDGLGLHRLQATAAPENTASHRVLEKAGFQREGLLRQNVLQRGRWRDSVLFARLATDS